MVRRRKGAKGGKNVLCTFLGDVDDEIHFDAFDDGSNVQPNCNLYLSPYDDPVRPPAATLQSQLVNGITPSGKYLLLQLRVRLVKPSYAVTSLRCLSAHDQP